MAGELISHLTFQSNEYACSKLGKNKNWPDKNDVTYLLWKCIISVVLYWKCSWYLQILMVFDHCGIHHCMLNYLQPASLRLKTIHLEPNCVWHIQDLSRYMLFSIPRVRKVKTSINVIRYRMQYNISTQLLLGYSFLVENILMRVVFSVNQTTFLSDNMKIENWTSIELNFPSLPMHLLDTTSFTTSMSTRKKTK